MITRAHSILYSRDADADRAFFRNVLKLPHVDVGGGWLIFGLPPAEVAIHPGDAGTAQEFYFMCADVEAFAAAAESRGAACSPRQSMDWGVLTQLTLPSGATVGVYQPRHQRPKAPKKTKKNTKKNKKAAQKAGGKKNGKAAKPKAGAKNKKTKKTGKKRK